MSRKFNRKAVAAFGVVILLSAAGAYAYWTTGGSGTGSATTGTSSAVVVTQIGSITDLAPGSPAQAVDFNINNPESTPQFIATVTYSIASVESAPGVAAVGCTAADFTLVQAGALNDDVPAGDTPYSPSGATLAMINSGSNQDGCKNVTVNLAFVAA